MKKGFISIIVVNWNGLRWLSGCFDSLRKQTYRNFEVILVEDDSDNQKETVAFVRKHYPEVVIVINKHHLGFAGGNNLGLEVARGEFILLLNNDTVQEVNYLKEMIRATKIFPNAASIQSKLLLMNDHNKTDFCAAYWTDSTILNYFGLGKNAKSAKYNVNLKVFSNKGASMLVRRKVIDRIGFLDDDFWTYYEETDFCHRAWIAGYECWYYPKAICYHFNGGTSINSDNSYIMYHNLKNKCISFMKNFEAKNLVTILPTLFLLGSLMSFIWLMQGKRKHFLGWYKALYWNAIHLGETLAKRAFVQSLRKKSDKDIFALVKKNPRLVYYYYVFTGLDKYPD